jgi:hypothetical protein
MEHYINDLNRLKQPTMKILANVDNLGDSCWLRSKVLYVAYQCVKYDGKMDGKEKVLLFKDGSEIKREKIEDGNVSLIDCREAIE